MKHEETHLEKLQEFLISTHPEMAKQGTGLKFPDAKPSALSDKLSCLPMLGLACFKEDNVETISPGISFQLS